jgi:hypothetical protein
MSAARKWIRLSIADSLVLEATIVSLFQIQEFNEARLRLS